ncbi:hypothetical protein E2C01_063591 [Portunus trituberculatus]|uniref:Uncharacterized protein n=1 Tax=Portunus trituberculatus TaxID=210409 RepID=A0A5B7HKW5_PORTR|nr:hypothetical protein [Portunus trituberculatus]
MEKKVVFFKTAVGLGMRTGSNTGITSNTVSERYSGSCEKEDNKALYTTKCAAV